MRVFTRQISLSLSAEIPGKKWECFVHLYGCHGYGIEVNFDIKIDVIVYLSDCIRGLKIFDYSDWDPGLEKTSKIGGSTSKIGGSTLPGNFVIWRGKEKKKKYIRKPSHTGGKFCPASALQENKHFSRPAGISGGCIKGVKYVYSMWNTLLDKFIWKDMKLKKIPKQKIMWYSGTSVLEKKKKKKKMNLN